MDWIWIAAGVFSVWALLRVIGAERQRRLHELMIQIAVQDAEEPRRGARAPATPAPAVRSKATR
jgi:hypothetical protein